tara:strand:- start:303 stop:431 length:129 start_codon:yes stop_codon:yes gene_type:complete
MVKIMNGEKIYADLYQISHNKVYLILIYPLDFEKVGSEIIIR